MTQLIADVLRRDEEARRVYAAAVDAQADQMAAIRVANPFAAWMGTPPGLDVAEFAMPAMWDDAEYHAPTARYRAI